MHDTQLLLHGRAVPIYDMLYCPASTFSKNTLLSSRIHSVPKCHHEFSYNLSTELINFVHVIYVTYEWYFREHRSCVSRVHTAHEIVKVFASIIHTCVATQFCRIYVIKWFSAENGAWANRKVCLLTYKNDGDLYKQKYIYNIHRISRLYKDDCRMQSEQQYQ